jgi:hypothetical protein
MTPNLSTLTIMAVFALIYAKRTLHIATLTVPYLEAVAL